MLQAQPTVDMPSGRFSSRQPIYFLVSALPIAFVAGLLVIRTRWPQTYSQLIREDGPLEMSQWLFYVIASIGAGVAMWRASRLKQATVAMLYLLLAVGLLVVAMEEISWGQRVFDFRTPEKLKERNTQGELSIHNIDVLQTQLHEAYMIVGLGAAFA